MKNVSSKFLALCSGASIATLVVMSAPASAVMSQTPIVASAAAAPPLVLLTMARDEKLAAPAYNDYSDIDGDGLTDIGYKTDVNFRYFGNFSSDLCYTYDTSRSRFEPAARTTTKRCSGQWSGDFLNYVTTSRMDALRRSLYGGLRSTDTEAETVLERHFIPQDSHVWGREYDPAIHAYRITDYTPLAQPTTGTRHLFANVTLLGTTNPLMRVLTNRTERIWNWVLKETPVAADNSLDNRNGDAIATNYVLRNLVCHRTNATLREADCKLYPGSGAGATYKPVGVLHEYGENRSIAFGLLSGTYQNARSGGALRRNIEYFDTEINATTGIFRSDVLGIVNSVNRFKVLQFSRGGSYYGYDCNPRNKGDCIDFVNPVAEMMYEGLRYLAGGTTPTPAFSSGALDTELGLSQETWRNPFRALASGGYPQCSKPIQLVVSDIKPTFDSDDLPGTAFPSSFTPPTEPAALAGLNVSVIGSAIWAAEGLATGNYFIGESLANTPSYDQSPSLKRVNSFSNIRGLAPEVPTRQGSYYAASVAKFGKDSNVGTSANPRNVDTYAIALSTPLPSLNLPTPTGTVKLIPVGQSLVGCSFGGFQEGSLYPANRIVGFYIERITYAPDGRTPTAYRFRVGFEDNEEGTDNDMDAIAIYDISLRADGRVAIRIDAEYAAGCIGQHLGFVIAGTTEDGKYLGVRDPDTPCSADKLFPALGDDVANSSTNTDITNPSWIGNRDVCRNASGVPTGLGTRYQRVFTPSGNDVGGNIPKDPLWYSVRYGGPKAPLLAGENPEGYFLVTNPALLRAQLGEAFRTIFQNTKSGRASSRFTAAVVRSNTRTYIPKYETSNWAGALEAYRIDPATGDLGARIWTTFDSEALKPSSATSTAWRGRRVFTEIGGAMRNMVADNLGTDPVFLDTGLVGRLVPPSISSLYATAIPVPSTNELVQRMVNFVRGDPSNEVKYGGRLRSRGGVGTPSNPTADGFANVTIGSIVNSSIATQLGQDDGHAAYVNAIPEASTYRAYVAAKANRQKNVYVGSNDGLLHAFNDASGAESWAFIPRAVQAQLAELARPAYAHRYTVDGPVVVADYYDGSWKTAVVGSTGAGARSVYALDVTDPANPTRLWEFSGADIPALGHVLAGLRVVRDSAGNWVVVFGNGYKSTSDVPSRGALIAIPLRTSVTASSVRVFEVEDSNIENGLGPVAALGVGGVASRGWVGDLNGNLWRLDLSGAYTGWKVSPTAPRLFQAIRGTTRQPITVEPTIVSSAAGGYLVYFGTGKFYEDEDSADRSVQSFYSIYDRAALTVARADLTQYNVVTSGTRRTVARSGAEKVGGFFADLLTSGSTPRGERIVASPLVFFGLAVFNTVEINDTDPCLPSLASWSMALNAFTGDNPDVGLFDSAVPAAGTPFTAGVSGPGSLGTPTVISTLGGQIVLNTGNNSSTIRQGTGDALCRRSPNHPLCTSPQRGTAWRRGL